MCRAFSCIVGSDCKVTWKLGIDSHTDLLKRTNYKDNTADPKKMEFARVEIIPHNRNYLTPDVWELRVDEQIIPFWWSNKYEQAAWMAHKEWLSELDKIVVHKPIIHPFTLTPPSVTQEHLNKLRLWASVGASVGDSVGDSVRASVRDSVWASVRASVRASVWDSVRASVRAYSSSFFQLPEFTKYAPLVQLWETGLVPSFDGKKWRLHGGPKAEILWGGSF